MRHASRSATTLALSICAAALAACGATQEGTGPGGPGPAAELRFTTQPVARAAGNVTISPALHVTIEDRFGNTVPTGEVTMDIGSAPWPGATLAGTVTANAENGVATFTDLRLDKPGTGYSLVATSGGITVTSTAFSVGLRFNSVAAGAYHTCALTRGGAYCWGSNGLGELGASTEGLLDSVPVLVLVSGGLTFTSVSAGLQHACGITTGKAMYCWGKHSSGQLGDGGTSYGAPPVLVGGGHAFESVAAGAGRTRGGTPGAGGDWGGAKHFGQTREGTANANTTAGLVTAAGQ